MNKFVEKPVACGKSLTQCALLYAVLLGGLLLVRVVF
jgi:hypothetical protein